MKSGRSTSHHHTPPQPELKKNKKKQKQKQTTKQTKTKPKENESRPKKKNKGKYKQKKGGGGDARGCVRCRYVPCCCILLVPGRPWLAQNLSGSDRRGTNHPIPHPLRPGLPRGAQVLGRVTGNLSFFLLQGHMCDVCVYGFLPSWSREPLKENKKRKN